MLNHLSRFSSVFYFISSGDVGTFSHREFSFTLEGDIYVRYKSFESREDFEREVKKLVPQKIDIGAVFSDKVRSWMNSSGKGVGRGVREGGVRVR